MITSDQLRTLLHYDPTSGVFTWLCSMSATAVKGDVAGSKRRDGYASIRIFGRRYYAHRLAWLYMRGAMPKNMIDHVNRDPNDNRFNNLREATDAQNSYNGSGPQVSATGYRGIAWHQRDNVWQARIRDGGKRRALGTFHTKEDAARAYDAAARQVHGEYAVLNFPGDSK